jgi:DNA-binding NarL/FixJ family response regulator
MESSYEQNSLYSGIDYNERGRLLMRRIFIVEDSPIIRGRIIAMLSPLKMEIIGTSDEFNDALASIRETQPDTVILDIRIKNGSGIDLLKIIKEEHPETRVIMLTNFPYPAYMKKCMDLGADYFFDKSNDFEKIVYVLSGG